MSVVESLLAFVLAIVPFLVVLVLLSVVSAKLLSLVGRPLTLAMGFLAVPLHELSHLLAAKLCGHRIDKVSFFWPAPDGRLGYVVHSYARKWYSPFALLLIGLAPLIGGGLAVYFTTYALMPSVFSLMSGLHIDGVGSWLSSVEQVMSLLSAEPWYKTVAWCWLMLSILLFSVPSKADFKGCLGAVVFVALVFIVVGALSPDGLMFLAAKLRSMFSFVIAPLLSGAGFIGLVFALLWILLHLRERLAQR